MIKLNEPGKPTREALRALALEAFRAGLAAADPTEAVRRCLSQDTRVAGFLRQPRVRRFRRVLLVGAGKAVGAMAVPICELLGDRIDDGCIVAPGHVALPRRIRTVCGSHPLPDERAMHGATEILSLAESAHERDLVIVVLSGGGSALLPLPVPGVSLEDLRLTTDLLLRAGADIFELNTVRKHLSRIQGGRLARAAAPATIVTLVLSDVVGNRLEVVASGPTVPDSTTFADAWAVLERYGSVEQPRGIPASVLAHLRRGLTGEITESPKPGDFVFARSHSCVVADNRTALTAMREYLETRGFLVKELDDPVIGEARTGGMRVGQALVRLSCREPEALANASSVGSVPAIGVDPAARCASAADANRGAGPIPAVGSAAAAAGIGLLFGGETTVTVRGAGRGGRSQELAVAAAVELAGVTVSTAVVLLAAGTDGIDGNSAAAGGLVDETALARAESMGLDPHEALKQNDCASFLSRLGDLVVTGPTGTNVGDIGVGLLGLGCGSPRSDAATIPRPVPDAPA